MTWFYVEGEQQRGPVSDEELEDLLRSGKINQETLIWREGMTDWQRYRKVKAITGTVARASWPAVQDHPGAICAECGKMFDIEDMIRRGDVYVCANCNAITTSLMGGAPTGTASAGEMTEEQILAAEYQIDIGGAVERAWNAFTSNAATVIGTLIIILLLFFVFFFGISVVHKAVSLTVPFPQLVDNFFSLVATVCTVPFSAGVAWFFLRLVRGERAELAHTFAGFTGHFGQLALFGVVQFVIYELCMAPFSILMAKSGLAAVLSRGGSSNEVFEVLRGSGPGLALTFFIGLCATAYLGTILTYTLLLIIDKNYDFKSAMRLSWRMVRRRWWMTFLFLAVASVIGVLGILLCFVGLLVTMPVFMGMKAVLYEDNFRNLTPKE